MARVLIVGCGCRGRSLAAGLLAAGYAVRGTTRDLSRTPELAASGVEVVVADPDRLATLTPHLDGVSALCWLMASATGARERVAALHGPRLRSLLEAIVDTHVRGFVYEASGAVEAGLLADGASTVRELGETYRMPVEVVAAEPAALDAWVAAMTRAVAAVLNPC